MNTEQNEGMDVEPPKNKLPRYRIYFSNGKPRFSPLNIKAEILCIAWEKFDKLVIRGVRNNNGELILVYFTVKSSSIRASPFGCFKAAD